MCGKHVFLGQWWYVPPLLASPFFLHVCVCVRACVHVCVCVCVCVCVRARAHSWQAYNEYSVATELENIDFGEWDQDDKFQFGGGHCLVAGGYQELVRRMSTRACVYVPSLLLVVAW